MKNSNKSKIVLFVLSVISIVAVITVIVGLKSQSSANATNLATVYVKYTDNNGNILQEDALTGSIGDWYTTERKEIPSYIAFGDEPLNKKGYFEQEAVTVTYVYQKEDNIKAKVEDDNQVYVDIRNHKQIREYELIIKSTATIDEGTSNLDGTEFQVSKDSNLIKSGTASNGQLYVGTITIRNEGTTTYTIEETKGIEGFLKEAVGPFDINIIKTWNEEEGKYEIKLEYDKTAKGITVELDEENEDIIVTFNHIEVKGNYSMKVVTQDKDTSDLISGVKFNVTKAEGDFNKEIVTENGEAFIGDFEISSKTNKTEVYYIEQTGTVDGYSTKMEKPLTVQVTKIFDEKTGKYKVDLEYDQTLLNVNADIDENNEITIFIYLTKDTEIVKNYDLIMKYFITNVDNVTYERAPEVNVDEKGNVSFKEDKERVSVANEQQVTLEARIYNNSTIEVNGKAVKIDIPDGFVFEPENEVNKIYNWVMYKINENGVPVKTDNKDEADFIISDYLLGTQIEGFNFENDQEPNYESLQVVFSIKEENLPEDRNIINTAEILDNSGDINKDNDKSSEYLYVKYFDLEIEKYIQVIYKNTDGIIETKNIGYDKKDEITKIDIESKKLDKTSLTIKYGIVVKNVGEIEGRALEVVDYIPEGLIFDSEKNPDWYQEGNIVKTTILNNEIIKPGETRLLTINFDWNLSKDSVGQKINNAAIDLYYNENNAKDVTDDNNDSKEVLVTVKTGAVTYAVVVLAILFVVTIIVFTINKFAKGKGVQHGK